ncbi:MAG: hypothetical protein ACFFBP_10805 [Promethearchaeota archaeon]
MNKKKSIFILFIGIILVTFTISTLLINPENVPSDQFIFDSPNISADIAGMDDVIITNISRNVEISGYGIVEVKDILEIENNYDNQINSIYIGIPKANSENLIYYSATKSDKKSSLLVERSMVESDGFEMIAIYFDSPLLPSQKKTIIFFQTFKDLITYNYIDGLQHHLSYTGPVFPTLPYEAHGSITAIYTASSNVNTAEWGSIEGETVTYDLDEKATYLAPFQENLDANDQNITIQFTEQSLTKLEISELNRDIFISPWGIIRVSDEIVIRNSGYITKYYLDLKIPSFASSVSITDDLGEILGTKLDNGNLTIDFIDTRPLDQRPDQHEINSDSNRPALIPFSNIRFILQYNLPFEQYFSINWFQESIKIDLFTTTFDYLVKDQTINLIIDGCSGIVFNTVSPDAIQSSQGTMTITYFSEYVSPLENKLIQITFNIDIFDLLLRPIIFILLIILGCSSFVMFNKTRKKKEDITIISKEIIPVHDIREYCSLCEEKNALILEIRSTTEALKRKKITKKKYKNIIDKNTPKIEEIEREIKPFKQNLIETGLVFENLVKKIEFLDAERISINDGLNLLEARYKEGKLPSRAAYQKLSDNFLKRRRKIDRNYDKLIQQLRSYLL